MLGVLKRWEDIPEPVRNEAVRPYYAFLKKRQVSLIAKRLFDAVAGTTGAVMLMPLMVLIAAAIKLDSEGPVFFRQERVGQYGKKFRIHKFRTMVPNAEKLGTQVTVGEDPRITKVGQFLRKYRLDELPQILDIISGQMSFVGTRPEVPKYVHQYTPEMYATLLMPAGVTSRCSIEYKDEAKLLEDSIDPDEAYVQMILPEKMKYNLQDIKNFSFWRDLTTMLETVLAVAGQEED